MSITNTLQMIQDKIITPIGAGPSWVAIMVICFIVGFGLKRLPDRWVPNQSIPLIIWLLGALLMLVTNPVAPAGARQGDWVIRQVATGFAVGFLTWLGHRLGLKPLLHWLKAKLQARVPELAEAIPDDDTALFSDQGKPEPTKPNQEPSTKP